MDWSNIWKVILICLTIEIDLSQGGESLPSNILPEIYTLQISTGSFENGDFEYTGNVIIRLNCISPTKKVTLHSSGLEIDKPNVNLTKYIELSDGSGYDFEVVEILDHFHDTENEFYSISLNDELHLDTRYYLSIPFEGSLREDFTGFYRNKYYDNGASPSDRWYAATNFKPTYARRAFPCFDEPRFQSEFSIKLTHSKELFALSNMPYKSSKPEEESTKTTTFEDTILMPASGVAFLIAGLTFELAGDTRIIIWAPKLISHLVSPATVVGDPAISYFENYFTPKSPLKKLYFVVFPDRSVVESKSLGLILYSEDNLICNILKDNCFPKIAYKITNDVADQLFIVNGNIWGTSWLQKTLSRHVTDKAIGTIYPNVQKPVSYVSMFDFLLCRDIDSMVASHPLAMPIGSSEPIFDEFTHLKGGLIMRMLNSILGDNLFKQGLSEFFAEFRRDGDPDGLWTIFTELAHENQILDSSVTVKDIVDTWTTQSGFPVVTVKRNYEDNTMMLSQRRFYKGFSSRQRSVNEFCWWIPMMYVALSHKKSEIIKPKFWLNCTESNISDGVTIKLPAINSEWVFFQTQELGYYIVHYDVRNWKLLAKALQKDHSMFSEFQRVQLIDDCMNLAAAGELSYEIALNLISYIPNDESRFPVFVVRYHLNFLSNLLRRTDAYNDFKVFVGAMPLNDTNQIPKNATQAERLFRKRMKLNLDLVNVIIPDNLRVYCNSIFGEEEWALKVIEYLETEFRQKRQSILKQLACTKDIRLLQRYLNLTLYNAIGLIAEDIGVVYLSVAMTDNGYFVLKDFLKQNYKHLNPDDHPSWRVSHDRGRRIFNNFDANNVPSVIEFADNAVEVLITALSLTMSDMAELKELNEIIDKIYGANKTKNYVIGQAIERVKFNINWHQKHYQTVANILKSKYPK